MLVSTVPETLAAFWVPLVRRLKADGWRVDGMAWKLSEHPVRAELDRVVDVVWSRRPTSAVLTLPSAIRRIRGAIERGGYDVVQVQTPVAGLVTRLAIATIPRGRRPTIIYSVHGFHFHPLGSRLGNMAARMLERLAARWTDLIVVTHEHDRKQAEELGIPSGLIVHIPGVGIDTDHFSADQVDPRAIEETLEVLGLPPGAGFVISVAELNRNKRPEHLVQAVARMRRRDIHLVLRGSGPREGAVRRAAKRYGVADRIRIVPRLPDLRPLLLASAGFALVSRREGLPVSLMEALSLGVPAVGTDIRGIRELLADGRGRLVPPDDVDALANALDDMVSRPTAPAHRESVRRHVAERHSLGVVLAMYSDLYWRAVSIRSASRSSRVTSRSRHASASK